MLGRSHSGVLSTKSSGYEISQAQKYRFTAICRLPMLFEATAVATPRRTNGLNPEVNG